MSDVTITFGGDLSDLNKRIEDLAKGGERAEKAVSKPMENPSFPRFELKIGLLSRSRCHDGAQECAATRAK